MLRNKQTLSQRASTETVFSLRSFSLRSFRLRHSPLLAAGDTLKLLAPSSGGRYGPGYHTQKEILSIKAPFFHFPAAQKVISLSPEPFKTTQPQNLSALWLFCPSQYPSCVFFSTSSALHCSAVLCWRHQATCYALKIGPHTAGVESMPVSVWL